MKRGRVCFCIFAAKSKSVLIYIQDTTVVFVSLLKISELYIISKSYGGPYKKHIITAHVLQQTTRYRLYYYCCTDASFPGANISDQSRACDTRSCLFLCPCIGVDICTDIYTEYSKLLFLYHFYKSASCTFPSHTEGRTKSILSLLTYYSRLLPIDYTTTAVPTQVSQGLISAIKAGRVKRGRVCFCVLASESTSVLIYILNTVHTVLFCITFKIQQAVHHSQVTR